SAQPRSAAPWGSVLCQCDIRFGGTRKINPPIPVGQRTILRPGLDVHHRAPAEGDLVTLPVNGVVFDGLRIGKFQANRRSLLQPVKDQIAAAGLWSDSLIIHK